MRFAITDSKCDSLSHIIQLIFKRLHLFYSIQFLLKIDFEIKTWIIILIHMLFSIELEFKQFVA